MDKFIKSAAEIERIAEGGKILGHILADTAALVKPGVSTAGLNAFAEVEIHKAGGKPSFLGYGQKSNPFPYPKKLGLPPGFMDFYLRESIQPRRTDSRFD